MRIALSPRELPHAPEAAARLSIGGAGIHALIDGDHVVISGAGDGSSARHCWRVALLNERLVAEADPQRAEILRSLIE